MRKFYSSFVHSLFIALQLHAFFPGAKSQEQTCFTVLEKDLSTVHPALFSSLDDIGRSQVEQLLRRLGVKSWSARELVNSHIIPIFKSGKWKVTNSPLYLQSTLFATGGDKLDVIFTLIQDLMLSVYSRLKLVLDFKAEHCFKHTIWFSLIVSSRYFPLIDSQSIKTALAFQFLRIVVRIS